MPSLISNPLVIFFLILFLLFSGFDIFSLFGGGTVTLL